MVESDGIVDRERAAADAFESRWLMCSLKRVDPGLYDAIVDQRSMFNAAVWSGKKNDIAEHGAAMCRGWAAALARMDKDNIPDDAYLLGEDIATGSKVAIGRRPSPGARVKELLDSNIVWLTPDEVAAMFAGLQGVAQVKALWPGAEITRAIDRYPDEPAQEDA